MNQLVTAGPRFADVRLTTGVRLHYAEEGDPGGHPVIMLHGYTDSWFSFSRVLSGLAAAGGHVYALDLRGHGGSDRPAGGYALADLAADVVAFLDAMGIARATLIGHCMGSFIAQRVAFTAPERVERLVLIGSATTARCESVLELMRAVEELDDPVPTEFAREFQLSTVHESPPGDFMDRVVAGSLELPARVWRAVLAGMLDAHPAAPLGRLLVPTLILWGAEDKVFPRFEQDALASAMTNTTLKVYAETGHAPHWERPEEFVRDVSEFLNRR